jgi:hypothetical protein
MTMRRGFGSGAKAARAALILLATSQAAPAHGQSLPNHIVLDCTGRAADRRGRTTAYHQTFFVSLRTRRFCVGGCGAVHVLTRWDGRSIDLSRQSRPMPPGSDEIDLRSYGMRESYDIRSHMLTGTEISNSGTHLNLTVRARCRLRGLDIVPVTTYLDNIAARDVIPGPGI